MPTVPGGFPAGSQHRLKRFNVNHHFATYHTPPAAFTLRAYPLQSILAQNVAVAATASANGHLRFLLNIVNHTLSNYILQKLGSTRCQTPKSPRSLK